MYTLSGVPEYLEFSPQTDSRKIYIRVDSKISSDISVEVGNRVFNLSKDEEASTINAWIVISDKEFKPGYRCFGTLDIENNSADLSVMVSVSASFFNNLVPLCGSDKSVSVTFETDENEIDLIEPLKFKRRVLNFVLYRATIDF